VKLFLSWLREFCQGCVIAQNSCACDWYGLVIGKVGWKEHEWNHLWTIILHGSWPCRWCISPCRSTRTPCSRPQGSPGRSCSTWSAS